MSVARFIADQRTNYRVPHAMTCVLLGVSVSWFYKWLTRAETTDGLHTDTDRRRAQLDAAVAAAFKAAEGLHGSPRLMPTCARWVGSCRRRRWRTRCAARVGGPPDQAPQRADQAGQDGTEVPRPGQTGLHRGRAEPQMGRRHDRDPHRGRAKLYLATVIDLYCRRLLGAATGLHPDAELACAAIKMAVAARGGRQAIWRDEEAERVIFHTDRGRPTPRTRSPSCAGSWGSGSRWAGSGRVSTMLPRRRSSPPWNGKCCPATIP